MMHDKEVVIRPLLHGDAKELSFTIKDVIESLKYYNDEARKNEISKGLD
jgi:hypothetical protein